MIKTTPAQLRANKNYYERNKKNVNAKRSAYQLKMRQIARYAIERDLLKKEDFDYLEKFIFQNEKTEVTK